MQTDNVLNGKPKANRSPHNWTNKYIFLTCWRKVIFKKIISD